MSVTFKKIDLEAIEGRAQAATPGPWIWDGNWRNKFVALCTKYRGRIFVMGFDRWGMDSAQPTFNGPHGLIKAKELPIFEVCPEATSADDPRVYRQDTIGIRHPDAEFIAHARQDIDDLLAYVRALESQLESTP